jgi:hypothetical protein
MQQPRLLIRGFFAGLRMTSFWEVLVFVAVVDYYAAEVGDGFH